MRESQAPLRATAARNSASGTTPKLTVVSSPAAPDTTPALKPPPTDISDYLLDLPPVPEVAVRVMHLVDDPDTSSQVLARTIASDQAIALKVLQMANSAFYGQGRRILTLSQAVTVLGQRTIRSLVLLYSIPASLKRGGKTSEEEKSLWEHASGAAIAARVTGRTVGGVDPETLFIAGLLHDVGKNLLLLKSPEAMAEVLYSSWPAGGTGGRDTERSRFGFDHTEIGGRVLEAWGLPPFFSAVARWHHEPTLAGEHHRAVRLVALANRITHHLGLGGPSDPMAWSDVLEVGDNLGLAGGQLETIAVETVNHLTSEKALYNL